MDAFESLIALLLGRAGYWTRIGYKVELTAEEKRRIGRFSSPRWELDVLAYDAAKDDLIVVECKSYLDSRGVLFKNGMLNPSDRYKLFNNNKLRGVVFNALKRQLRREKRITGNPAVSLCLAVGKTAGGTDREEMREAFERNLWLLMDERWIREELVTLAESDYENDVAMVVAKLLIRSPHWNSQLGEG